MSDISYQDIETIVSGCTSPNTKIVSQTEEPFSKHKNGIMGSHYLLSIDVLEKSQLDSTRSLHFFVKTLPDSSSVHDVILDKSIFLEEVNFYNEIYPRMKQEWNVDEKWSPICYLAKPDILVLEDLRSQGYAIRPSSIFEEASLMSALTTLARFHAASIVAEKRLGKPLNCAYPDAFCEKIFTDVGKGGRSNKLGFDTLELLARRFHLDGAEIPKILKRICELVKPMTGNCNALCHGDLWRGNIMFKDEEKKGVECLLVDFQMLRYASPTVDVAMLLFVHASPEMRERLEPRMLEHYYAVLKETLLRGGAEVPAYLNILEDYQKRRIIGMAYSALRWPAPVMARLDDARALESWYFHTRIDIYNSLFDADPAYEAIMKAYLEELITEGKRISGL